MRKTVMAVAGAALAVALAGCSGSSIVGDSPSGVAEDFARAIIDKDTSAALGLCDIKFYKMRDDDSRPYVRYRSGPSLKSQSDVRKIKDDFEKMGKDIDDDKLDVVAVMEVVETPGEHAGSAYVDGKKYTGESAEVTVQCVRGGDKKKKGLVVSLIKADGAWKVIGCRLASNLDDLYFDD